MLRLPRSSVRGITVLALVLLTVLVLSGPRFSEASGLDDAINGFNQTASEAGLKSTTAGSSQQQLNQLVGTIVKTLLGLTGVIFMILIIAAGDLWMTAGGNEEKITKARSMIFNGVVGLAIVFAAYLAADFVVSTALETAGL